MANDHLRIMCPSLSCRKVLAVPTSSRGKNVRCKNCGSVIKVPEKQVVAAAAPAKGAESKPAESGAAPAKAA